MNFLTVHRVLIHQSISTNVISVLHQRWAGFRFLSSGLPIGVTRMMLSALTSSAIDVVGVLVGLAVVGVNVIGVLVGVDVVGVDVVGVNVVGD